MIARLLSAYFVALAIACVALFSYVSLTPHREPMSVVTTWKEGKRVARRIAVPSETMPEPIVGTRVFAASEGEVDEAVVGTAPLVGGLRFGLVPGRDGVRADLDGKTAYATADDLLLAGAYDRGGTLFDPSLGVGVHRPTALQILAEQLGVTPAEVDERARFTRVRFERLVKSYTADNLSREHVLRAIREGAEYLARSVDDRGKFRYVVDAGSGKQVSGAGYSWPRHAGATYFLAQAAHLLDDPDIRWAALRAAALMRDERMVDCGVHRCIAEWDEADVGSSSLAIVAFAELVRTGADGSYRPAIAELAAFLRGMQRPDGELMHIYLRGAKKPKDVQLMYFTGEAALALSRAHLVTDDPRDLEASRRALAHLVTKGWSFFGSRYFWAEEHWTCQATDDLWTRAPNEDALRFCLGWHEFQRRLQRDDGDSPFDADGSFGTGFIVSPRTTPAASRGEAAGATLAIVRRANAFREHEPLLDRELRKSVAFLLRHQLAPGPTHLFAAPDAVRGAMPGSPVDWQLRIDYVQHAGSAMIRWLELGTAEPSSAPL